jgi:hypothetical protein
VSARQPSTLPSGPARFVLEAGFIILVGVIAAVLNLTAVVIVIVMGLAWVVVVLVERAAKSARPRRARRPEADLAEPTVEEEASGIEEPEPETARRPRVSDPRRAVDSGLVSSGEWNLWELERRAREHAGAEAVPEEWAAMFMYLREYAKSDGALPPQFDSLVRESFPELTRAG